MPISNIDNGEAGLSVRSKLNQAITSLNDLEASGGSMTGAQIKVAYEGEADTNAFTDAEKAKLTGISGTNTGDQDLTGLQDKPSEGAFIDGDKTKLDGIAAGAEVNTIESDVTGEPTGSDQVLNVVSLTQAEYDAGTPVATTLYVIV
jgi:hypothetical protein